MKIPAMFRRAQTGVPPVDKLRSLETASPYQLMWLKFRDHRVARWSLSLLAFFYFIAIFCEVAAPHDPWQNSADHRFAPPQMIHLFHNGSLQRPFVYPWVQKIDSDTKRITYLPDTARPAPLRLFVKGDPYKLWHTFSMNRHFIGTPGARLMLLGADRMGRDLLSRIIYGSRISLSIGLAGVFLSLILASS